MNDKTKCTVLIEHSNGKVETNSLKNVLDSIDDYKMRAYAESRLISGQRIQLTDRGNKYATAELCIPSIAVNIPSDTVDYEESQ